MQEGDSMPALTAKPNDPRADASARVAEFIGRDWDAPDAEAASPDALRELGMMHMTGHTVPVDLVAAHKWFNLAAMHGDHIAVRLRREIAAEMSPTDVAAAQRAARDWLSAR
jgi:TPR repeat protein